MLKLFFISYFFYTNSLKKITSPKIHLIFYSKIYKIWAYQESFYRLFGLVIIFHFTSFIFIFYQLKFNFGAYLELLTLFFGLVIFFINSIFYPIFLQTLGIPRAPKLCCQSCAVSNVLSVTKNLKFLIKSTFINFNCN